MPADNIILRRAENADADACAAVLAPFILNTAVNMHGAPLPPSYFAALIAKRAHFFVAEQKGEVCGYACADEWNARCGYAGTMEVSVYIRQSAQNGGTGGRLLTALLDSMRAGGIRAAVALIALPNPPSVRLHEKLNFAPCGVMPKVGWKFNAAHDIGVWVCPLV